MRVHCFYYPSFEDVESRYVFCAYVRPCVHVCVHVSVFRKVKAGQSNIRTICRFEYTTFEDLNGSQRLTDQTCFLVCFSQLLSKTTLIDSLDLNNSWPITCSSINSKSGLVKYGDVTKMV